MAAILDIHRQEQGAASPFPEAAHTPVEHFRIAYYAAVAVVWEQVMHACGDRESALAEFPFLQKYVTRLEGLAGVGTRTSAWWMDALRRWEGQTPTHLPIRSLRESADLDGESLAFVLAAGLAEEDPSFGLLYEVAQARPGVRRPTASLLHAWWRNAFPERDGRSIGRALCDLGLLRMVEAGGGSGELVYEAPAPIWDALRGCTGDQPLPGCRYLPPERLPRPDDVVLPETARRQLHRILPMLAKGEIRSLALRGPSRNGRTTALMAIARQLDRGALVIDQASLGDPDAMKMAGPLATMLGAMPILRYALVAGEKATAPDLAGYAGPVGIAIGQHGGLDGERIERLFTIDLPLPDAAIRVRHWSCAAGGGGRIDIADAARRLRLTSGNIHRVAALAPTYAALDGRESVNGDDLRRASGVLSRQALDTLATLLPPAGDMGVLAVRTETRSELGHLVRRCRHRDELGDVLGDAFETQTSHGIRALFTGPSGTGKTFAARLLAAELGVDLYRIDLAAVVDKYIGETEKNLGRLFAVAEELDVMLLLDEGDALLGERSAVHSATDRYANLETNYLLQRLETFDGILVITTNAGDRIDPAFERRMDVVVPFHLPEARERLAIWRSHLPAGRMVPDGVLEIAAGSYKLSGGQIRNAALHAGLLAMDDGGVVTTVHLDAAIQREYRKLARIAPPLDPPAAEGWGHGG